MTRILLLGHDPETVDFAPSAAIAFNTRPDDSADAAARALALARQAV